MKFIVRSFVIALAVTGAFASSFASATPKATVSMSKTSAMPAPTCPPWTGDCGFGNW
jgi:hypothetical protein